MCFSATASLVAGSSLSGIGASTIKQAKTRAEVPYASIPLLFGIQQVIEGVLWIGFHINNVPLQIVATYLFTVFSHILWPVYVPFAILKLERVAWRRKVMYVFQALGAAVGLFHAYFMLFYPLSAEVVHDSIIYIMPRYYLNAVVFGYLVATCGSPLFSSHRWVRWFGVAVTGSAAVAYLLYTMAFVSVWCFFAAILSLIIYMYFVEQKDPRPKSK